MTTDDKPSSAGGGENLAASIRRRREEEISLKELLEKMGELSGTIGAVSLSIVAMDKELTYRCDRAKEDRDEDLRRLKELQNLVEHSLKGLVDRAMEYPGMVRGQMERFREESTKREQLAGRVFRGFLVIVLGALLIGGFLGWKGHEVRMAKSDQREALLNDRAMFGRYILEEHEDIMKKQWKGYQDWLIKIGVMPGVGTKP